MPPSTKQPDTAAFLTSYEKTLHSFSLPERLSGKYTLINCIRHSSEKEIYLLSDSGSKQYLLKKETAGHSSQLRQEYTMLLKLSKCGKALAIPACIDFWEEQDLCYLLRTYIPGYSLVEYTEKHPSPSEQELIQLSLDICALIGVLHSQLPPIIHRDIKPENFVLQKDTGILYLIDLDTARQYMSDKTKDTQLMGTPSLAAPEQFGFCQSDFRTDIYGIGKTMLYLATGTTSSEDLKKNIPFPALRRIIKRAIAFSPEKRYPSIQALQKALLRYKKRVYIKSVLLRRLAIGLCIFLAGLGTGVLTGKLLASKQTVKPMTDSFSQNGAAIAADNTTNDTQTAQNDSNDTGSDNPLAASGAGSLRDMANVKVVDLWQYREQVDSIILSYYNADYDSVISQLENLVSDLYADEAIMQIAGEDYACYDVIQPEFWNMTEIANIRARLAYRDRILQQKLGSYSAYRHYIINSLGFNLDPTVPNNKSSLYRYATGTAEDRAQDYYYALSDILCDTSVAFDTADGFETPKDAEE